VAHERLGLFDTPPDRQEIRLSLAIVGLLFAALLIVFPLRDTRLGEISAFVPLNDAFMLFSELIIATLLYAQATVFRSRALTVLASLLAALIHSACADVSRWFQNKRLAGAGINTTAWLAIFRRLAFPIAVTYALLAADPGTAPTHKGRPRGSLRVGGAVVWALGTLLTTSGHDLLPPIFSIS
jgi:hypothetical protein